MAKDGDLRLQTTPINHKTRGRKSHARLFKMAEPLLLSVMKEENRTTKEKIQNKSIKVKNCLGIKRTQELIAKIYILFVHF